MATTLGTLDVMSKNLLTLLDNTLASTARTLRAVVLIAAFTVASGTAPGLDALFSTTPAPAAPTSASVR